MALGINRNSLKQKGGRRYKRASLFNVRSFCNFSHIVQNFFVFCSKLKALKREHFLESISGLPQHFGSVPDSPHIIGADPDHPPGSGAGSTNCENAVQRQLSALSDYASHGCARAVISHSPVPGNTQLGPG